MMKQLNPPVIAFILVVLVGWCISIYYDQWWWMAMALALGLLAGDIVEALMPQKPKPEKSDRKETPKRR